MTTFDIVISIITAIGSLATAFTFIYMLISQKGTQKQIDSLAIMAEMQARHYQIARLQAGSELYPKIQISLGNDSMYGLRINIKNMSYPINIYRVIVKSKSDHCDITINHPDKYYRVNQNEERGFVPGQFAGLLMEYNPSIRLFMTTPFDEAYEVRFAYSDDNNEYQSEAIPIFYSNRANDKADTDVSIKRHSLHGGVIDKVEEYFPEIADLFK